MDNREFDLAVIQACLLQCDARIASEPNLRGNRRSAKNYERMSETEISKKNDEYFMMYGKLKQSSPWQYSFFM